MILENDQNNICFICGDERNVLDKKDVKKGYDYHTKYEHKIWDYVYFLAYIEEKEESEYTGIESFVWEKFE